ncbi:hypothetical protein B0H19DRAFT_1202178, partial [Mycena capillaripes]
MPEVEVSINGVRQLASMVFEMNSSREDLSNLQKCLDALIAIDASCCGDEFQNRLAVLTSTLEPIRREITILIEQGQFFTGQEIKSFKNSITCCIQDFTFHGDMSIEKFVQDMVMKAETLQSVRGRQDDGENLCPVPNTPPIKQIELKVRLWPGPLCSAVTHFPNTPARIEPFSSRLLIQATNVTESLQSNAGTHDNPNDPGM